MSDTKAQMQEAQRTPSRIHAKNTTTRPIIFKLQKIKDTEKILKEAREGEKTPLSTQEQIHELH